MKKSISKRIIIEICVAMIVVGVLLAHEYKIAGLVVTLMTIAYYMSTRLVSVIKNMKHIKNLNRSQKVEIAIFVALLYILVRGIVSHDIPYFLLIVILAIEYLMNDKSEKR